MQATSPRATPYGLALALVSALLFGASTPASKVLLEALTPFQLAGLLYLGAAAAMAPAVARERRRGGHVAFDARNAWRLAGAVLFGGVLGPVLLLFGLRLTLAGSVSLLLNLEVVATALLGALLFREPLGRSEALGVAGVAGAGAILAGGGGWPGLVAALLVALACLCWGLDNHLTALVDGITPARSTLVKGAAAGATNLAIGLGSDPVAAGPATLGLALGLGALSYGVSIALYIAAAHELGATRAQAVFASAPFAGAALAFGLLGEPLGADHVAAGVLLVASIALLHARRHEHLHVHEPVEHVHSHRHDDGHHLHAHPGLPPSARHSHVHRHERLVHAHPHWPDLHHRHAHPDRGAARDPAGPRTAEPAGDRPRRDR
jgi:drug/metabolite transporter (DMT)-like permease